MTPTSAATAAAATATATATAGTSAATKRWKVIALLRLLLPTPLLLAGRRSRLHSKQCLEYLGCLLLQHLRAHACLSASKLRLELLLLLLREPPVSFKLLLQHECMCHGRSPQAVRLQVVVQALAVGPSQRDARHWVDE